MSNLAKTGGAPLLTFTDAQVALIKSQIAPKATPDELQLFLYAAKRTGLDPLAKQVYCIHRNVKDGDKWIAKMTIQTGIDGYRVVASRTGLYAGQSRPTYTYKPDGSIESAEVIIYKFQPVTNERYEAAIGVAYWDEYVVSTDEWVNNAKTGKKIPSGMWAKMPRNQLAKVAEALALRKAFPQDLSGIYTTAEMEQADNDQTTTADAAIEPVITKPIEELKAEYIDLLKQFGEYVGEERANKSHPDNWVVEQTPKNFVLAISAIQDKLTVEKLNKQNNEGTANKTS